ncbi:hypothetical protein P153DRAFT_209056 [Dothidotthia symphoricarpi CBS 119687]|uniref:Xylanolytic transcriptional activator regulatory domain-containing protein n=1 Tax=Dothidotthia symphoricarpi CBS 119687 TaxID=1392245 RepID=A0A6A6AIG5_9PLEO|nr:uncharacterized protein P153DRAFT_209056 [Dothidotthia symphoricarpi CBS 119687]KAF2131023.1 hypothetical protein P153DRAFT_209056 [Dothidotthia symphoricarpi CBS 119687]
MVEGSSNEFCPDSSFYLYDHNVEVDDEVDVHQFPSFELASKLLQQYLGQVHGWLPMIPQDFEGQVRRYYEESQMVPAEWLAMLNLVFAIGSRHYYLINTQRQAGENQRHEHALYMSRAIQLLRSRSADLLTTSPNLPLVQAFGLLSFYQLAVGYVERAWVTIGLALRVGIALGMHLKNKENSSLPDKTDELSRVWWSLLSLQTFLCSVTGRPSAIPQYEINTPFPRLPAEYREGRSEIALQLNFKISVVAQWAMSSLYSVRAATLPWPSIQKQVVKLKSELEKLLPAISDRERLILHFSWFDSMILITRPCLGRRNDNAGPSSIEAHKVAAECIQAAQGVTRLLPDEPSERIFQNGPWWCLSLYIMRAMAVLLLAQAHQSSTSTNDDMSLNMSTKKLILWLRWMRPMDPVADRGLNAVLNTLRRSQNHANFADVFEQESADAYGGYLLVPGRWEVDTSAVYPQLHPEFEGFDDPDFLDSVLSLSSLPMPPVYGSAFAVVDSSWDW